MAQQKHKAITEKTVRISLLYLKILDPEKMKNLRTKS